MNSTLDTLAMKYAKACLSVYGSTLTLDEVEQLRALGEYLFAHRDSLVYVQLSSLDSDAMRKKLESILTHKGTDGMLESLINLLIEHKRVSLLPHILKALYAFYLQQQGIMKFIIESPLTLSHNEISTLKSFLEKQTGEKIIYETKKNTDLIAGLKVYSDTRGFEQSIRKNLRALER